MKSLLLVGWIGAMAVSALSFPIAAIIASNAVEAYLISAKDPSAREIEQKIFEPPKGASKDSKAYRDAVMSIYGSQTDDPTKVVFVPKEKFVHPVELPSLTLLPVDKQRGENPLQLKTVYFFQVKTAEGAGLVGALLLIGWLIVRRKPASPAPPSPAA